MDLQDFITHFTAQFEETDKAILTPQTCFRDLDEWSSLIGLSLMGMAKEEYNVILDVDDIRNSTTILDLYEKIKVKL
jgi:acyl carrier protein